MKLLIFSDIHGSLRVAEYMLSLIAAHKPDAVLVLGDVLYHGPRNPLPDGYAPGKAAEALRPVASKILAVQGNCDSAVDSMVLPFPLASEFFWVFDGKIRIFATHGHIFGPHRFPLLEKGDVLLFGHTHLPVAETSPEGIHLCNPGSLALPKDGSPPSYGLFEDGVFSVLTGQEKEFLRLDCR